MTTPRNERRAHERYALSGPVTLVNQSGREVPGARLANVSDGGMFVTTPVEHLPAFGSTVEAVFRIPRSTANTHMLEKVRASGRIARQQPMRDDGEAGVAVRFDEPLDLMIEV